MKERTRRIWRENLAGYGFIAPFIIVFAVFLGYPVVYSFYLSLHKTTIYSNWYNKFGDMSWCGLANYAAVLSDKVFWWSLISTLIYACLTIPTGIIFALALALILKPKLKGFSFFRSGFFLPNVFDMFVVGVIWLFLYNPNDGLFIRALLSRGVQPIARCVSGLVALLILWVAPAALAYFLYSFANQRMALGRGRCPIGGGRYSVLQRFIIADIAVLPFYLMSLSGLLKFSFIGGAAFALSAVVFYLSFLNRANFEAREDAAPELGWTAVFFGFIFFLEVIGALTRLTPIDYLFRLPLIAADGFIKELGAGFLGSPYLVLPSIAFAVVLKGAGFGMVLFLTAINNISPNVLEAAEIDGCTGLQRVRHVILPLVKPIILFMIITGLAGALNSFTEVYSMTSNSGGPSMTFMGETVRAARISGFHLFRVFDEAFYGQAAAISYILLVIALVISLINIRLLRTED